RELALQTVVGAGALASTSMDPPAVLRARVTSPGGTTQAAIETLEAREVGLALRFAIEAARDRGAEIGRELAKANEKAS
ncbi:MAG: pyrroline-5-carboxylate reductase dimerization domain-containing protein, partial [Myxococcota bacterium]|nr:pyrroline-5-carboxylate reductase dimerization domain-containing protein [Myxococcota bacterium]